MNKMKQVEMNKMKQVEMDFTHSQSLGGKANLTMSDHKCRRMLQPKAKRG